MLEGVMVDQRTYYIINKWDRVWYIWYKWILGNLRKIIKRAGISDKKLFWGIPENNEYVVEGGYNSLKEVLNLEILNQFKIVTSDMKNFEKVYITYSRKKQEQSLPIVVNYVELL